MAVLGAAIQLIEADLAPEIVYSDTAGAVKFTVVKSQGLDALVFALDHPVGGNVVPSKFSDNKICELAKAPTQTNPKDVGTLT